MSNDITTLEDKPRRALILDKSAEKKALSIYHNFYEMNLIKDITSFECIVPDDVFIKILNDMIFLSQQRIEDRIINTKFIFFNNTLEDLGWPTGFRYIPIKKKTFPSLDLSYLKKFLEMASDPNIYLVVGFSKVSNDTKIYFSLNGFAIVDVSMNHFISKFERTKLTIEKEGFTRINKKKLKRKLKCTVNSVFCKIKNSEIELSYFNEKFLNISKGMLIEPISIILDVGTIIAFSKQFSKKLNNFDREELRKIAPCCLIETLDSYKKDIREGFYRYDRIKCLTLHSLTNIILRISETHHGSTIIFGFKGDIKNEEIFQPDAIELNIPYGDSLLKYARNKKEDQEILRIVVSYENAIVSLSKTDGAIIFDSNLNLVSVGTFFKVKTSATTLSSMGGARLKSAECFIENNIDTIAFVISQDGTIHFIQKKYTPNQLKKMY